MEMVSDTSLRTYDNKGRFLGFKANEEQKPENNVSVVWIVDNRKNVLIQRRSKNVSSPNKWGESAGGHIDDGENPMDAAVRETKEEIGLDITKENLHLVGNFRIAKIKRDTIVHSYIYYSEFNAEDIKFDKNEVQKVEKISFDELKLWLEIRPSDFKSPANVQVFIGFIENLYLRKELLNSKLQCVG